MADIDKHVDTKSFSRRDYLVEYNGDHYRAHLVAFKCTDSERERFAMSVLACRPTRAQLQPLLHFCYVSS